MINAPDELVYIIVKGSKVYYGAMVAAHISVGFQSWTTGRQVLLNLSYGGIAKCMICHHCDLRNSRVESQKSIAWGGGGRQR